MPNDECRIQSRESTAVSIPVANDDQELTPRGTDRNNCAASLVAARTVTCARARTRTHTATDREHSARMMAGGGSVMSAMASLNQSNSDAWASCSSALAQQAADPSMGQFSHGRKPDWREQVNSFKEEEAAAEEAGEEAPAQEVDHVARAMEAAAIEKRQHDKLQAGYDEAARLKDEGAAAFKKKQYAEAVRSWGDALRSVDGYGRNSFLLKEREELRIALHNNRAVAQIQLRNFSAAEGDAADVLFTDPNNAKALFRRGQARIGKRDYHAAVEDLEKLVALKPNDLKAKKTLEEARDGAQTQPKAGSVAGARNLTTPAEQSKAASAPRPQECEGGMAFMRAQQHLGGLTIEELHAALVLEVGEAEASGVAKYQSTMVAALSEALISLGRERGDNDLVRLTRTFSLATHFLIQI